MATSVGAQHALPGSIVKLCNSVVPFSQGLDVHTWPSMYYQTNPDPSLSFVILHHPTIMLLERFCRICVVEYLTREAQQVLHSKPIRWQRNHIQGLLAWAPDYFVVSSEVVGSPLT